MGLLIDSNFFFGLLAQKDKYHQKSVEIFNSNIWTLKKPIVTSCLVIDETYTLAMYRTKRNLNILKELNALFEGEKRFFRIIHFNPEDYQNIYQYFIKYSSNKKLISFVDASLIYISKTLNYEAIISFDAQFDGIISRVS